MKTKLSARVWASFILIGLVGQVAWTVENMYFNVFLYNTISTDPSYIAAMEANFIACGGLLTMAAGMRMSRIKMLPLIDMLPSLVLVMPLTKLWLALMGG